MKKIILLGFGVLALIGVSVSASLFFAGALNKGPEVAAALPSEAKAQIVEEVFYHNIQPEFVVNFQGKTRLKFLMIEMVVATYDEKVLAVLDDHDPELRNNLLMLLAEQDSEFLKTVDGKQALRDAAVERIDELVARHYRSEQIADVFITRLVMQ